jgi:hypothetical protein
MSRTILFANQLSKRAANLEGAGAAILAITLIGSAIMMIAGLANESWMLGVSGAISALIAWWLYALSSVVASRAHLAAEVAAPLTAETAID